jgi:hypothetical protein
MSRRLQFSLKWLLWLMALTLLVGPPWGYAALRSWHAMHARHEFETVNSDYEFGKATFQDMYDHCCRLRDAELAVPFANRKTVLMDHLNRLARLEEREQHSLGFAVHNADFDDSGVRRFNASIAFLATERKTLERELATNGTGNDVSH